MALIRSLLLGLLVYAAIAVCFPNWTGEAYHVVMLSAVAAGAVAVWFLEKILDLGSGAGKIGLELSLLAAIALFLTNVLTNFTLGTRGHDKSKPVLGRVMLLLGQNFDGITTLQRVMERNHPAVHPCPHAALAHIGMDGKGKIHGG